MTALSSTEFIPWNGRFTIENTTTGEHRTFQIKTQPSDAKFAPEMRVLSLLTGPNNERDYTGFAFVLHDNIHIWSKNRAPTGEESTVYEKLACMITKLVAGREIPRDWDLSGYEVHFEKRCRVCNRVLTRPESIVAGIGSTCAGRM